MIPIQWIIASLALLSTVMCQVDPAKQNATVFSIMYGYPLIPFVPLAQSVIDATGNLTNKFNHHPLAHANFTAVVRPNVDTMYSVAIIDLGKSDMVLTVPDIQGHYLVVSFHDLYGNNFLNHGTLTNITTGNYNLVRHCGGDGQSSFAPTSFTRAQEIVAHPSYERQPGPDDIVFPTTYGILLIRILVKDDEDTVAKIQKQFKLAAVVDRPNPCAPPLTMKTLTDGISGSPAEMTLQLTARLAPFNPPEVEADVDWVNATLELAGIANYVYTQPHDVDLASAEQEAHRLIALSYDNPGVRDHITDQWSAFTTDYSGDFKSHYDVRALIANMGYLQLQTSEALYPSYDQKLLTDRAYNITFYSKPPVNGFWSLTVYNSTGFLVDNPYNVYALGDRSGMTYPNGTRVYKSDQTNGTFYILLQAEDIPPRAEYQTNWIPAQKYVDMESQEYFVNLRWYAPNELMESYQYPLVTEIDPVPDTYR